LFFVHDHRADDAATEYRTLRLNELPIVVGITVPPSGQSEFSIALTPQIGVGFVMSAISTEGFMRFCGTMFVLLAVLGGVAKADDATIAREVIDKAITAHGGESALAKRPVVTANTMGTFHGHERTPVFFFKSEITNRAPDQWRQILDGELKGQKFYVANVLDGKRGWVKMEGNGKQETRGFTPAELEDRREDAYVNWVCTLLPLKSQDFMLTLVGEEKFNDVIWKKFVPFETFRPAVGVRVTSKGHRDVTLFFDKESRLLVKTETRSRAGTPAEGKVETILRRHKAIEGVQRPMMLMTFHDGKPLWSHWVMEYRVAETAEAGMFAKP
jgi:hypothetical protein